MTIETSTYIADWNAAYPANTDTKSEGDDHIRKIKTDLQATLPGFAGRFRRVQTKSGAYTAVLNDNSSILRTSGTWTLSGTAVATLGNGWEIIVYNDGSGTITFDPSGAELVNGAATLTIAASTWACIWCDGSAFRAVGGRTDSINLATTDTAQTFSAVIKFTATPEVISTDAGATIGPQIVLDRNSASPAASDQLGVIRFRGRDSAAGANSYADIYATVVDPTAGAEDGQLIIRTVTAGADNDAVTVGQGVQVGAPTSGDKGSGTINAAGTIYQNNVPVVTETGSQTLTNKVITSATGIGQSIIVRKTADETITSSTTLQDDDHLTVSIAANQEWVVTFNISGSGDSVGHRVAITVPTGATLEAYGSGVQSGGTTTAGRSTTSGSLIYSLGGSASSTFTSHVHARVANGANAGSITLQWAQSSSAAPGTVFYTGSHLVAHRVA